jgi:conjugal transfer pilus assembly protein TraF
MGFVKKLFSVSKDTQLRGLSKIGGLWMFFDSKCQFCKVQAHVLDRVAKKYNFKTKFILILANDPGLFVRIPSGR